MSSKRFPVYAVTDHQGKSCGHQHQQQFAAENCAVEIARRVGPGRPVSVIEFSRKGENVNTNVVSMFEARPKKVSEDD